MLLPTGDLEDKIIKKNPVGNIDADKGERGQANDD
jgi:hypothetical protein